MNEKEVYDEHDHDEDFKDRYSTMPGVGTRVRRGRDWHYGNQDSQGVGTVTGHSNQGTCKLVIIVVFLWIIFFCTVTDMSWF